MVVDYLLVSHFLIHCLQKKQKLLYFFWATRSYNLGYGTAHIPACPRRWPSSQTEGKSNKTLDNTSCRSSCNVWRYSLYRLASWELCHSPCDIKYICESSVANDCVFLVIHSNTSYCYLAIFGFPNFRLVIPITSSVFYSFSLLAVVANIKVICLFLMLEWLVGH